MKKIPGISEAEWEVMKVLWRRSPLVAQEIIDELSSTKWHHRTIRTLIARLVRKKAVGFTSKGRTYSYRPLVEERDCVMEESESFLSRLFGGSMVPMVAHFIENRKLSQSEIRELSRILHKNDGSDAKD